MAFVEVSPEHMMKSIVTLAGGTMEATVYRNGGLQVDDVSQEALDAALATYMGDLNTYLLQPLRESKVERISHQAHTYIDQKYPSFRRELFIALAEEARNSSMTNRVLYINQLLTWIKNVVAVTITADVALETEADVDIINNYSVDFSVFDATDPEVTVRAALEIID